MPGNEETHCPDRGQREKTLKQARCSLWLCPLGMLLTLVLLGFLVYDGMVKPGVEAALMLIQPVGGVLFFAGWWHQARQTIRSNGIESRNVCLGIGLLLLLAGPALPLFYRRAHLLVFYGASALLLLFLLGGLASWVESRKRKAT